MRDVVSRTKKVNGITSPGGTDAGPPTFSLVIPVYNVEAYLPAFLDSIAGQTTPLTDCELIFVHDGSTDGSVEVIRAWIARTGQAIRGSHCRRRVLRGQAVDTSPMNLESRG